MLSSTTCVGLRYGQYVPDAYWLFLGVPLVHYHRSPKGLAYYRSRFNVLFRKYATPPSLRPHFAVHTGVGILTHLPSASPLGLSLGPG
jgi:hypothetical protein